ncbi:hypothetical protein BC629DRAFT_1567868 [Irpex lacteus]|nr:hypothetical protein BC629DRAFT_1567868 [Irpex lacteus]
MREGLLLRHHTTHYHSLSTRRQNRGRRTSIRHRTIRTAIPCTNTLRKPTRDAKRRLQRPEGVDRSRNVRAPEGRPPDVDSLRNDSPRRPLQAGRWRSARIRLGGLEAPRHRRRNVVRRTSIHRGMTCGLPCHGPLEGLDGADKPPSIAHEDAARGMAIRGRTTCAVAGRWGESNEDAIRVNSQRMVRGSREGDTSRNAGGF